jgi:hypothetical protein
VELVEFKIKKSEKDTNKAPCQKCGDVSTKELHTCPYACEINDDYDNICNCCSSCEHECAMDI